MREILNSNCVPTHRLMHHVSGGGSAARLTQAHHHLHIVVFTIMILYGNPQRTVEKEFNVE